MLATPQPDETKLSVGDDLFDVFGDLLVFRPEGWRSAVDPAPPPSQSELHGTLVAQAEPRLSAPSRRRRAG